ncbi:MAG: MBL fold metallo-hydrolase [Verrucomicrobiota bacterium]
MNDFSLKCFGVGDGWPSADRGHSSFLYRFGKTHLLIDCGEPVSAQFKSTGLSYDTIDRIFVSHLNFDHIGGFFMLMQGFWLERRKKDLSVHVPSAAIPALRQMLEGGYIFDELLPFRLRFVPLCAGEPVTTGGARVTPFPTTHLHSLQADFQKNHPVGFESYSFLIEAGRLRIAHSADLGAPEDLGPTLERRVDLLVCELAHFNAEDLLRYLHGRDIRRIAFVHLAKKYWENIKATRRLASKMLGGIPFSFPQAGEELTLKQRMTDEKT